MKSNGNYIKQVKGKIILFAFLLCSAVTAVSQVASEHYLFPQFEDAVVVFKTGLREAIPLNYNTVTEEMVFLKDNQFLALDFTETIDSIYIKEEVFIPHEKYFLLLYARQPEQMFIRHKNRFLSAGKSTGYGTSQTNAIDNYSTIISSGKIYELNITEDFQLIPENSVIIKRGENLYDLDNIGKISRLYSVPGREIRNIIKTENLNPENIEDLKELIIFLK